MPTTTRTSHQPSRRDSWPPTQLSIYRSIEGDDTDTPMDMDHDDGLIDDTDPMNSFLTPSPLLDDGDTDDEDVMDMDPFDAGIEDPHRPAPIIRSISPSKLSGGLRRSPPPRTPTPPHLRCGSRSPPSRNSPEVSTPNTNYTDDDDDDDDDDEDNHFQGYDDDDDGEDYVRFTTPGGLTPFSIPTFNLGSSKSRGGASKARRAREAGFKEQQQHDRVALMMARVSAFGEDYQGHLLPSPLSFHIGRPPLASSPSTTTPPTMSATRVRSSTSFRPPPPPPRLPSRPRSWSGANGYGSGRLSPRAWREPSPDVWSIEEEAEVMSEMELDGAPESKKTKGKGKKVRFALPVREEIP